MKNDTNKIACKSLINGAADRDRTGTTVARREILSLLKAEIKHFCKSAINQYYNANSIRYAQFRIRQYTHTHA